MNHAALWDRLSELRVTHVIGLPDTETGPIFARGQDASSSPRVLTVCREGEAYGIAAGIWAGGGWPIVLIQSTGFFEAGDALRSVAHELDMPLDLIIGWRGRLGKLNAGYPDTARDLLEPTLHAWRIEYEIMMEPDHHDLADALRQYQGRSCGSRAYLLPQ